MIYADEDQDFYQYSRGMDFIFDSQSILPQTQNLFQDPIMDDCNNPTKRRKPNDQFNLQRFSLQESQDQRKQRLDKKREDKKFKLEQYKALKGESEKSTTVTDQTSSQQEPSGNKEEVRKIRNRNSAQLSRDRKKNYMSNVVDLNTKFQDEIDQKNTEIRQHLSEIDMLNYKIKAIQDLGIGQSVLCPYCKNTIHQEPPSTYNQEQTFSRVQNVYSSRHMKTYGLLSLFVIVTMLGCLNSVQQEGSPVSLMQIRKSYRQDQKSAESFFNTGQIEQNVNAVSLENIHNEPFQRNEKFMEVTTMDQLRNLKTFSLTEDESSYNIKINFKSIPTETAQTTNISNPSEKTLFFNCTVAEEKCDTLIRVMNSREVSDIHHLSPFRGNNQSMIPPSMGKIKEYSRGQQITILQVFQESNKYILNTVNCIVDGTSNLQFDSEIIDKLTL